jgi:hypothetical protein
VYIGMACGEWVQNWALIVLLWVFDNLE